MIEVRITGRGKNGTWPYSVVGRAVEGRSRQPLLDACRALKRMGEPSDPRVGLFWGGSAIWSLRTTVGAGAALTVVEEPRMRFAAFKEHPYAERRRDTRP